MEASLSGCREKLRRAELDLSELDRIVEPYEKPLPLRVVYEPEAGEEWSEARLFVTGPVPELDPSIYMLVGHIIHDLRCALDYLAHELTALGKGRLDTSQFPIADTEASLSWRDKKTLEYLTPKHRAFVESLQPREGRNYELVALREMSNQDKHRLLVAHVMSVDLTDTQVILDLIGGDQVYISLIYCNGGAIKPNAEVAAFRVWPKGSNPRVYVSRGLPTHVGIEDFSWRAVNVLDSIRTKIVKAVEEIAQDFPA